MNSITLIGNVGALPVEKTTASYKLASFTLATNINWTDASGVKQQRTEWHNCFSFDEKKVNLITKHIIKGQKICVVGELVYNQEALSNGKIIKHASISIKQIELL